MPQKKKISYKVHRSTIKEELPVNAQIHSGSFSVMFWGCFSKRGLGPLIALEGSMNSEKYVELLEVALKPELEEAGVPMIFMQDNAPCHTSKLVSDYLGNFDITVLEWPPQSPDLNPIENSGPL